MFTGLIKIDMLKYLTILCACLIYVVPTNSQIINKKPLSIRQTGYNIDVKLDPATKTVKGTMLAFWVNKSTDIVPDIRLHLYMNAFKNNETTMNKESGGSDNQKDSDSGWIDLKSLTDRNGNDLTPLMKFISPDDGNMSDHTVLQVMLPKPSMPGDTVFINAVFETRLPLITRRTGYADDFYFVAQWFPKFGVYESAGTRYATKGAWNCHQFHANSEFYSDHSLYLVRSLFQKNTLLVREECRWLNRILITTGKTKLLLTERKILWISPGPPGLVMLYLPTSGKT